MMFITEKTAFLIILLNLSWISIFGQVRGLVLDSETNKPLPGAVIQNSKKYITTSNEGVFQFKKLKNDTLIISHVGYKTDSVILNDHGKNLEIFLIPDHTHLELVTIHGPLLQNSLLRLPSSASLITRQELLKTHGAGYVEKLNGLPGVFVHSGALNTNRITIRGIGSRTPYATNRIKVYYNDIPMVSGDGNSSMEDIDPFMIQNIQLIKGSKSALYGSGLGGVIMISGKDQQQKGIHGEFGLEGGTWSTWNPRLSIAYRKGKFTGSASYSYAESEGWRDNSSFTRHGINVNTSYKSDKHRTDLLVYGVNLKAFIPSSLDVQTFNENPEYAASNWNRINGYETFRRIISGLKNEFAFAQYFENSTVIYLNLYDGYESRPFNILDDHSVQMGLTSKLSYSTGSWEFFTGLEAMNEHYGWEILETNEGSEGELMNKYNERRNPINFFLHGGYNLKNGGIIETGISLNFLHYEVNDMQHGNKEKSGKYNYEPVFSPFVGINIPVIRNIRIYASFGHGFSYPTVEETLLPEGQINPDIKPENGLTFELGSRISLMEGNLFADATLYMINVEDLLITERLAEDVFTGKNAGKTRHMGFEFQSLIRINKEQQFSLPEARLSISYHASHNEFIDFVDDGTNYSGFELPGIPSDNLYIGTSFYYKKAFYAHYQYHHSGKQFLDDGNTGIYGSWSKVNVKTGYKIRLKDFGTNMYVGIKNLFNSRYVSMILVNAPSFGGSDPRYYYPGKPRHFYAGLMIDF